MRCGSMLLCTLLFVAGCSTADRSTVDAAELLSRPFTAQMQLTWNGEEYAGSITSDGQEGLLLTLTGETLDTPVSFACKEGSCVIAQEELSLTLGREDLPSTSLPSSIQRAFVLLKGAGVKEREEEIFFEAGAVKMACRRDDLALSRLDLERGGIRFTEFAFGDC